MKLLLLRPYYGVTVHGDMHGELGISDYLPQVYPDLSFIYAGTILSKNSENNLHIIDANAEKLMEADVINRLHDSYDCIIIKFEMCTVQSDIKFAQMLKRRFKSAKIIVTGYIVKLLKKWIEKNVPEIDSVSELPIEQLAYNIANKTSNVLPFADYPVLDYTIFPYKNYVTTNGELLATTYLSRGCAIGCKYCPYTTYYGGKFEKRPVDKVIADIKSMLKLGVTNIQFRDQFFTYDKQRVLEFCTEVKKNDLHFSWHIETRLESLDEELIDIMVSAGLNSVNFGIESASLDVLQTYGRPIMQEIKQKKLIEYMKSKNITTLAFFIIGFPDDTWESIDETYKLAVRLSPDISKFSIFMPNLEDKSEFDVELTPSLFPLFKNNLSYCVSKHLSLDELYFLLDNLSCNYYTYSKGSREAYYDYYFYKKQLSK